MAPPPSAQDVLAVLAHILDPDLGRDVVSLGMIKDVHVDEAGRVAFTFELTTPACPARAQFRSQAEELVGALPGVTSVDLKMTSNVRPTFNRGGRASGGPPGVRQTIAVASGKGGVGKSTTAVNLAAALHLAGARVGLLDADVYGPSVPSLLGADQEPAVVDQKLVPIEVEGIRVMSMGVLAGSDRALIWRGPLVGRFVSQMLSDVEWGELDYLVVDLPPGTGDASLTLAQSMPLGGVVIVSTPQDVALDIAIKALHMFQSLNVPILGLVENMSWYVCPNCGHEAHVFAHGGGEAAAARLGIPFLGAIPLDIEIRSEADAGRPIVLSQSDSPGAGAFRAAAAALAAQVSIQSFRQLPVITVR